MVLVSVLNAYHLVLDDSVTDRGLGKEEGGEGVGGGVREWVGERRERKPLSN